MSLKGITNAGTSNCFQNWRRASFFTWEWHTLGKTQSRRFGEEFGRHVRTQCALGFTLFLSAISVEYFYMSRHISGCLLTKYQRVFSEKWRLWSRWKSTKAFRRCLHTLKKTSLLFPLRSHLWCTSLLMCSVRVFQSLLDPEEESFQFVWRSKKPPSKWRSSIHNSFNHTLANTHTLSFLSLSLELAHTHIVT